MSNTTTQTIPTYSPYQCAKAVNEQLAEAGVDKTLPPQMFYTYVNKQYIKSFVDESGKKRVTHEALAEWFVKYCTKNQIKL